MKDIQAFHQALSHPQEAANAAERPAIGYVCSYAPEELIHAAGFHPIRLFPPSGEISLADNHLQVYGCHLIRGILEDGLAGNLDYLFGMVFPHTCDAIQRLSDIWRLNMGQTFFADVAMPTKLNAKSARNYMVMVLARFKAELEEASGHSISTGDLEKSIALYNGLREKLSTLYRLKTDHPGILSAHDLNALTRGTMVMDRQRALGLLESITADLTAAAESISPRQGKRILITGSICGNTRIHQAIERAGGLVVADDLCTGQRWFDSRISPDKEPLEALASRYLNRHICPAKHQDIRSRQTRLTRNVRETRADGVIFLRLKFCDPLAFDYPHLAEALDGENIPHLLMELGDPGETGGQITTRLETFTDML